MKKEEMIAAARAVRGNEARIKNLMKRAEKGDHIKIGFLGGSITQGSLATQADKCYAACVYRWWVSKFPQSHFLYINAGIGGTTSLFGAARAHMDLLRYCPDFVVIDFTVNDEADDFFMETFEGVIRRVYYDLNMPAVMVLNNVFYHNGKSAREQHDKICACYGIPSVSVKDSIYRMIQDGTYTEEEITSDHLHPNDTGHRLLADILTGQLEKIYQEREMGEEEECFPISLTANRFERANRFQIDNCRPLLKGFCTDCREKTGMLDLYKNGWFGIAEGDSVTFFFDCSFIAVQFRRSVRRCCPVALAVVDGDESHALRLDGNFDEDWGDCLYLQNVLDEQKRQKHSLEIRITGEIQSASEPFYIVSIITDGTSGENGGKK